jgi:hypothetical protein
MPAAGLRKPFLCPVPATADTNLKPKEPLSIGARG